MRPKTAKRSPRPMRVAVGSLAASLPWNPRRIREELASNGRQRRSSKTRRPRSAVQDEVLEKKVHAHRQEERHRERHELVGHQYRPRRDKRHSDRDGEPGGLERVTCGRLSDRRHYRTQSCDTPRERASSRRRRVAPRRRRSPGRQGLPIACAWIQRIAQRPDPWAQRARREANQSARHGAGEDLDGRRESVPDGHVSRRSVRTSQ